MIVSTSNFGYFFALEKLDKLWVGQVLLVSVTQLSLVFVLSSSSPGIDLSLRVES
jgi:hypothetical protein